MESTRIGSPNAGGGQTVEGVDALEPCSQATHELVSELSQVEYQLRAWSDIGTPGWEQRAGVDLMSLRSRKKDLLTELRVRGMDFAQGTQDAATSVPSSPMPDGQDSATGGPQPDVVLALERKVQDLERALRTRTVIGEAKGILMERHNITAEEAFEVLVHLSSVTNRKLAVIAAEFVQARSFT